MRRVPFRTAARPLARRLLGAVAAAGLAVAGLSLAPSPAQAIAGGGYVGDGQLPYVAQLSLGGGTSCTGTLISRNWVLTAVHCVETVSAADQVVRVGNGTAGVGGQLRRVSRIIKNPSYRGGHDDVALLRLNEPITNITPARLGNANEAPYWDGVGGGGIGSVYDQALAAGWGQTSATGPVASTLQYTSVFVYPTIGDGFNIPTIPTSGGPCYGDSGGPLLSAVNGVYVVSGVVKGVDCVSSANYSRVSEGANRTFLDTNLAQMYFTSFGAVDWDKDGSQDIITRNDLTGDLWLYPGTSVRGYTSAQPVKIGNGWNGWTFWGATDWDKDGNQDILTRNDTTGDLWLYPGQSKRAYSTAVPVKLTSGWNTYSPMGIADWDRDGKPDFLWRDGFAGTIWVSKGNGSRTPAVLPGTPILRGYNGYSSLGATDWDRDGSPDLILRNNDTGNVIVGMGRGVMAESTTLYTIANGWIGFSPFGATDWDRDGNQDLIVRDDTTRDLWLYPGTSVRGYTTATRVKIGNGW